RGESAFGFRHVLVQEAAYRAAPKRLRAELHERFADRLDETSPDLAELDEFVGHHLAQAYHLPTGLGEADRRTERLAGDGGRRLGAAGMRAFRRGDMPATLGVLQRSIGLVSSEDPVARELRCNLAIALFGSGESRAAAELLEALVSDSEQARDTRQAAWA